MNRLFSSFATKIIALVLILSLIPLIMVSTYLYYSEIENEKDNLRKRLESLSGIGAQNVGQWLEDKKVIVESIGKTHEEVSETKNLFDDNLDDLEHMDAKSNLQSNLLTLINQYDWLDELFITDHNTGEVIFTTGTSSFPDGLKNEKHFQEAADNRIGVSTIFSSINPIKNEDEQNEIGVPTMFISVPISEDGNEIEGVLTARINVFQINPSVKNYLTDFDSADLYLVNSKGYFLSGSAFPETLIEMGLIENRAELELLLMVPETGEFTKIFKEKNPNKTTSILNGYEDYRGISVVGSLTMIPETDWSYIVEVDEKEAYLEITNLQYWLFTAIGGIIFATIIITSISATKLVSPIRSLTKTISKIDQNSTQLEIDPKIINSNDEIGILGKTLQTQMEQIKFEESQLESFKTALDESALVAMTDLKGNITYVNDLFCNVSKYPREELVGKNHRILKSEHHTPEFYGELWKTVSSGKIWRGEIKNKAKDGSFYWVKSFIMPVFDAQRKITSYIAVRTDITKEKETEELLLESDKEKTNTIEKQLAELKQVDKQKDEFVAMMSHELKTPLTPIKIYSSSLRRPKMLGELNEKQTTAVDSIIFNTQRLEKLVTDLLDAQKLELGKMRFDKKEVKIDELMEMMIQNLISQTKEKGGQLINETSEKITIKTDSSRLAQVLTNLINNAIDFVPKDTGKITIKAEKNNGEILFSVKDNGIGMSKESQSKLFKKFFQTDTSVTRKHGGTGLGLTICRGIVNALGGKIWVESQEGRGSDFYFTIPEDL
jgi:PAS domain S-box-containing protein